MTLPVISESKTHWECALLEGFNKVMTKDRDQLDQPFIFAIS